MQRGETPMNVFYEEKESIPLPLERATIQLARGQQRRKYVPGEAGYSRDADKIEETMNTWFQVARS